MPGYDGRLCLLAFDHHASFTRDLFGLSASPTPEEAARVSKAKEIIFEGFLQAMGAGAPRDAARVLVDEAFGSEVARRARAAGVLLAMPAGASGRKEFDFEYGDAFGEYMERFDPTIAKVLVRYNLEDLDGNRTQTERLKRLSDWLRARGRLFLFELLVPATPAQLAALSGDADRYDRDVRPRLMVRAVAELQFAVGRTIWLRSLAAYRDGAISRAAAAAKIAASYLRTIEVFTTAAAGTNYESAA